VVCVLLHIAESNVENSIVVWSTKRCRLSLGGWVVGRGSTEGAREVNGQHKKIYATRKRHNQPRRSGIISLLLLLL
jgi:hypothetical protein